MDKYSQLETDIRRVIPTDIVIHPYFKFNPDSSGYRNYVFGCSAGPYIGIDHLLHEICHAVQFGSGNYRSRMVGGIFHFKTPKAHYWGYPVNRMIYDLPKGNHASMRELETLAMQYLILTTAEIEASITKYISVLEYVGDYMNYDVPYSEKERQFHEFKNAWTVDKIWDEFRIILNKIKRAQKRKKYVENRKH